MFYNYCCFLITFATVQFSKSPKNSDFIFTSPTDSPQHFIAHRGFSSVYTDNTIPAVEVQ